MHQLDMIHDPWQCSWFVAQTIVKTYFTEGSYQAADILRRFPDKWEDIRKHWYLCYVISERKKNPKDAWHYNEIIENGWRAMMSDIRSMYGIEDKPMPNSIAYANFKGTPGATRSGLARRRDRYHARKERSLT